MRGSASQEHDARFLSFSWDLLCSSSSPPPFLFTFHSYLLLLSLLHASSVPNLFPSSKNMSLSLCIFHVFLCFAFPPAAFLFSSSFFTQETISLSLDTLQQNQLKLFYTNDLQHRNTCSKSMCKRDLVMKKKTDLKRN